MSQSSKTEQCQLEIVLLTAQANGFAKPVLRTESFIFKPAPAHGRNPNTVYVTGRTDHTYYGKIKNNWFWPSFDYTNLPQHEQDSHRVEILQTMQSPMQEAIKYGKQSGKCSICGRTLHNKISIFNSIGPICAEKMGWPLESPPNSEEEDQIDMTLL